MHNNILINVRATTRGISRAIEIICRVRDEFRMRADNFSFLSDELRLHKIIRVSVNDVN